MRLVNYWRKQLGGKTTIGSPNLSLQFTGALATWLANYAIDRECGQGRAGRPDLLLEDSCSNEARGEERTSQGPIIRAWDHKQPWWAREHPHRCHAVLRLSASAHLAPAPPPVLGTGNEGGIKVRDVEKPESVLFAPWNEKWKWRRVTSLAYEEGGHGFPWKRNLSTKEIHDEGKDQCSHFPFSSEWRHSLLSLSATGITAEYYPKNCPGLKGATLPKVTTSC